MSDLVTMCLMGLFVIVGLALLSRLMGSGFGGTNYTQRGNETSHYDDPDIDSRGSFGGWGGRRSSGSGSAGSNAPRHDSPNIRSRGSFGRSKR
jgi:hypothetical protein